MRVVLLPFLLTAGLALSAFGIITLPDRQLALDRATAAYEELAQAARVPPRGRDMVHNPRRGEAESGAAVYEGLGLQVQIAVPCGRGSGGWSTTARGSTRPLPPSSSASSAWQCLRSCTA